MKLSSTQKEIVYGLVLGDAFLQQTGKQNARLRLEHSYKQEAYMAWLHQQLENLFTHKPTKMKRVHPATKKTYGYVRLQSHSSPWFGKLRNQFYPNGKKTIPEKIGQFLKTSRTLAVWYMDDGYYYQRDKSAHIYMQKFSEAEICRLVQTFEKQFSIRPKVYCRPNRQACQLTINGQDLKRFVRLIRPHIIPSMEYKLPLDPVTTESEKHTGNRAQDSSSVDG